MRVGALHRSLVVTLTATLASSACTLANAIDVCSRVGGPERDLNGRTEGDQALASRNASAAMPGGGAMVVWTSTPVGTGASEARGGLTTADGTLLPTCDATAEYTYSAPGHPADQVVLAAPRSADTLGAVVYRRKEGATASLWVVPITPSGCPMRQGLEPQPFLLAQAASGTQVLTPSVATLGDGTFAVTWTEAAPLNPRPHLMARRFRLGGVGVAPTFAPTALSPTGAAAEAVELNAPLANGVLAPVPDGAALAYFEVDQGRYRVWLVRLAPDLAPRFAPVVLADVAVPSGLVPSGVSIALAWEPDTFLVGWMAGDEQLSPKVEAAFLDGAGRSLSAPRAPGGGPFRLGSTPDAVESELALAGTGDGGFLAAWQESGVLSHLDRSGPGVRALAFDAQGAVRFANRACDTLDFPLNLSTAGDQTQPALALLGDGTVLATWVTSGGETADRSGSGLRAEGLTERELVALP